MDEPPSFNLASNVFFEQGLAYPFLLGIAGLFFIAAFISACEAALFSLTAADLDNCRKSNSRNDRSIGQVLDNPHLLHLSFMIIQIAVKIAIITVSTFFLWSSRYTTLEIAFGVVVASLIFLLFGDLFPKIYGHKNAMSFARAIARVCGTIIAVFRPISLPLLDLMKRWEKNFVKKRSYADELSEALEMSTNIEVTTEGEKDILQGIVNFGTLTVRQVMRSRSEISAANSDLSFVELMVFINKSGFSRIPIYRTTLDNIEGVLYIKDLLPFLEYPANFEWKTLLRPVFFVSETKKIDLLLKDFQEKRVHMAIVTDDRNIVKGLVTLEDLIEEIIGEINDEFDEVNFSYRKIDEKTFVFDGRTSLFDFCNALETDYDSFRGGYSAVKSIGDLIFALSDGAPVIGKEINFEQFTFIIESADRKKIKRVRVNVHAKA